MKDTEVYIEYEFFNTSEEFLVWQKDNPTLKVHSVQPIAISMGVKATGNESEAEAEAQVGHKVFVTYVYPKVTDNE